jgi:hypothetical protein
MRSTSGSLIKAYPWLNTALFPFRSKSFVYCAIPKVASKTLISIMLYVYVRDIIDNFNNNGTNTTANEIRREQLINIRELIQQLQKV